MVIKNDAIDFAVELISNSDKGPRAIPREKPILHSSIFVKFHNLRKREEFPRQMLNPNPTIRILQHVSRIEVLDLIMTSLDVAAYT